MVAQRSPERGRHRERGDILGLVERPVEGCEGAREGHLPESDDKVHHPEQHEQTEELQVNRVPGIKVQQCILRGIYIYFLCYYEEL